MVQNLTATTGGGKLKIGGFADVSAMASTPT